MHDINSGLLRKTKQALSSALPHQDSIKLRPFRDPCIRKVTLNILVFFVYLLNIKNMLNHWQSLQIDCAPDKILNLPVKNLL
jgi:hypothetical protein